jgi:drug/metabolite transporter (DMT)-like permease
MSKHKWFVPCAAIFACVLWSTAFVAIKEGLKHCSPFSFAGIRFLISGLLLTPFWLNTPRPLESIAKNYKLVLKTCLFQTFLLYGLFYWGMTMAPASIGAIVTGLSPIITAVVAHIFMSNDKMNLPKTLSLLVGFTGICIITFDRNPFTVDGLSHLTGIALVTLAVVSSAFGNIAVAKDKNNMNPVLLTSIQIFLGGFFLLMVGMTFEGVPKIINQPPIFYAALLWLSFLSATAFSLWFILLKKFHAKVSYLNMWKVIIPALGAALSWILLPDDKATVPQVIGIVCVAASVIMCNKAYSNEKKPS